MDARLIWGGLALVFVLACSRDAKAPELPEAPTDFSLSVGEGGGMAGQWSGASLDPTRTVSWWAGRYERERADGSSTATDEARRALWSTVDQAAFFSLEGGPAGNLSRFIEVTAEETTHRVSWPVNMQFAELDSLYEICHRTLSASREG